VHKKLNLFTKATNAYDEYVMMCYEILIKTPF
jgi:hypothetical protein